MIPLGIDPIMAFDSESEDIINCRRTGLPLAARSGHLVSSYPELLKKVAALHFHNPRFKLLFRGQANDYKSIVNDRETIHSNLFPALLRGQIGENKKDLVERRFAVLSRAEYALKKRLAIQELHTHQLVRWAILQHYEVCPTPLLDVSYSLHSALSFAVIAGADIGYLYVLAVPQISGPITTSLESLTQTIDLTQVCPPDALRPHFQSAVLIGDYPILTSTEMTHSGKAMIGNNFSCRLLSKFQLGSLATWTEQGFHPTEHSILSQTTVTRGTV